MKNGLLITAAICVVACGVFAASFTDIDSPQYYGKINIPKTHAAIDANFALVEAGSVTVSLDTNKLWVGNDSQQQTAMGVTGDVTITQDGTNVTTAVAAGVIVNADVATNAAIAESKLSITGATTNQTFLSATGVTNTLVFTNGILKAVQ